MSQQNPFDPPQTFAQQGAPGTPGAGAPGYPVPGQPPIAPAPEPARKSWFARHTFLTVAGAIAAIAIIAAIAGGGGDGADDTAAPAATTAAATEAAATDATTEQAPATTEAPAPEPAEVVPGIGATVADGKFGFVVTSVETGIPSIGDDMFGTQAQGAYTFVHVTITNIGDKAQAFFGDNQTLVDTQDREHSADTTAAIYLENSESMFTEINPGNSVNAIVVFDIPADAVPASVTLHDSMFSGGVTVSLVAP